MVYHRSFWEEGKYAEHVEGEGYPFTVNRRDQLLDIPYLFSMIAVNHGKNVTGKTRLYTGGTTQTHKKSQGVSRDVTTITSLTEAMDEETQEILSSLATYLKAKRASVSTDE
jgi:hypothetical protein